MALLPVDFSFWNNILDVKNVYNIDKLMIFLNRMPECETIEEKIYEESKFYSDSIIIYTENAFLQELRPEYRINFLDITFRNIDYYIKLIEESQILKEFSSDMIMQLQGVKDILNTRYPELQKPNIVLSTNKNPNIKLQWNGGISVLATLFHDLMYTFETSNNTKYVPDAVDTVINFLMNHFTDDKGEELTKSTLEKYIKDTKTGNEKRASLKERFVLVK